jgi:hypothetical protein
MQKPGQQYEYNIFSSKPINSGERYKCHHRTLVIFAVCVFKKYYIDKVGNWK